MRNRNIDIYKTECTAICIYELALHPEFDHPKYRFKDQHGHLFVTDYFEELRKEERSEWNPLGRDDDAPIPYEVDSSDLTVSSDVTDTHLTNLEDGYIADFEFPDLD